MKFTSLVIATLIATAVLSTPWRLAVLAAEVMLITPGNTRISDGNDKYWEALDLEAMLAERGYRVDYVDGLNKAKGIYGATSPQAKSIIIDGDLHWNARFAILAHEAGHVMQPGRLTRNQGEAFAESVAMLVAHDGYREHARYLANGLRVDAITVLLVEWRAIYHAAAALTS